MRLRNMSIFRRKLINSALMLFLLEGVLLVFLGVTAAFAATPAGTVIRSQAEATYLDEYGTLQQATSNEVQTLIQQAPGVSLSPDTQNKLVSGADEAFTFPHTLTNTGNYVTEYKLSATSPKVTSLTLYPDEQKSGQSGSGAPVEKVYLAPGESFQFIVSGQAPKSPSSSSYSSNSISKLAKLTDITVEARVLDQNRCSDNSTEKNRCYDTSIDSLWKTDGTVFKVTKAMDKSEAYAGEKVKVTLSYERVDNSNKTATLLLQDMLPQGLDVDKKALINSLEWSPNGKDDSWKPLNKDIDDQGSDYCSTESVKNNGKKVCLSQYSRRIEIGLQSEYTPQAKNVPMHIRFDLEVQKGFEGQTVFNYARYRKWELTECSGNQKPGADACEKNLFEYTNRVPLKIFGYGVTVNGSPDSSAKNLGEPIKPKEGSVAAIGNTVTFVNYLWNTGSEQADYEVAIVDNKFPTGSLYCLAEGEQSICTPDQTPQSAKLKVAELNSGEVKTINVRVKLPYTISDKTKMEGMTFKLRASLYLEGGELPHIDDTALNKLPYLTGGAGVDLTLNLPLTGNAPAPGKGKDVDPEAAPVIVKTDGTAAIDNVFINNTGSIADSYKLSLPDNENNLPEGFTLTFFDSDNNVPLSNSSGVIAGIDNKVSAATYKKLKLLVSVPKGTEPGHYTFTIKAQSPIYPQSTDTMPLSIEVKALSTLTLEPNGEGQVMPGSFITFSHRLTNLGNTEMTDITLSLSDTLKGQGWQSVLYEDRAGNAELSSGDPLIKQDEKLSIQAGKTKQLIVKVFAPANAMQGIKNITTVKASWSDDKAIKEITVTDTATVNNTNIVITKEQAQDKNCNLSFESATFSRSSFKAQPDTCVLYKLTATNHGAETVSNVVIHDAAPNFTRFDPKENPEAKADGSKNGPIFSGQAISATWGSLNPGTSVTLYFRIKIQ